MQNYEKKFIRRYNIIGCRRISNYLWASIIFLGAFGFFLTGIASFNKKFQILPFLDTANISFFPQGIVMCFYGFLGIILSFYLWLTILWDVGGGFNEFNKKDGFIRIFRWGFPGKTRMIDVCYSISDAEAIRVEFSQGLSSQRTLYLRVKGKREIPLNSVGQPLTIEEIEKQAADLAKFLSISVEEK